MSSLTALALASGLLFSSAKDNSPTQVDDDQAKAVAAVERLGEHVYMEGYGANQRREPEKLGISQ